MYISHIYSANFTSKCGAIALLVSPFKNKELGEPERDGLLDSSLSFNHIQIKLASYCLCNDPPFVSVTASHCYDRTVRIFFRT